MAAGLRPHRQSPSAVTRSLRTELCGLVSRLARATPEQERVLLEVEVDRVRYQLVRCIPVRKPRLTRREADILRLVIGGLPNKLVADRLGISAWTVATHMRRLFAKFDVNSRSALVGGVMEAGILLPDAGLEKHNE